MPTNWSIAFLFESANTFRNALLPGQHTFLLKWPLFLLIHLFGATGTVFSVFTVCVGTADGRGAGFDYVSVGVAAPGIRHTVPGTGFGFAVGASPALRWGPFARETWRCWPTRKC